VVTSAQDAEGLLTRFDCLDLVRTSFRLIDEGHAGATAELYAANATLVTHSDGEIRLQGEEIRLAMRQREKQDRRTVHVVSPSSFQLIEADQAECVSHLQVYVLGGDPTAPPTPRLLSQVHDELVLETDGRWRIAARRITVLAGRR
jgi:hypothetical protein